MNNTVHNSLLRAKLIDEPFVRQICTKHWTNYEFSLGTEEQDWQHIDILLTDKTTGQIGYLDVKRNESKQWNSPNFTFTFINPIGKTFEFKERGLFAYIDDVNGSVYVFSHKIMSDLVDTSKHFKSKWGNKSQYILINKQKLLSTEGVTIFPGNPNKIQYLALTRNEELFNNIDY